MADEDEETENKIGLDEIQFFPSSSQTNIYGLVKFYDTVHGCNKVLMASLKGSVTCITSQQSARPTSTLSSHNLSLRNLQGSDIVSIDAFESDGIFHFGVTYIKNGHTSHERKFLNIYSGSTAFQNELSFDNFQTFDLEFVPFQLIHANTTKETVFLLSGGDRKIHLFKQNDKTQLFVECKVEDYFPEFKDLPSSALSMDIYYDLENKRRISAYACQSGTLKVALCTEKAVMKEWLTSHDGPISSVKFFTFEANSREVSEEMKALLASTTRKNVIKYTNCGVVHLLVTAVIEPSVVYEDVINNGLNKFIILPDSDQYDCVLCSHVNDLTWSGTNEILLGTYGQKLLVYKIHKIKEEETETERLKACLFWTKSFSSPLFAMDYIDMTNDGVRELIVASSKGLHVLQHKFPAISVKFQEELSKLDHVQRNQTEDS